MLAEHLFQSHGLSPTGQTLLKVAFDLFTLIASPLFIGMPQRHSATDASLVDIIQHVNNPPAITPPAGS
jgi:hypothetical protein